MTHTTQPSRNGFARMTTMSCKVETVHFLIRRGKGRVWYGAIEFLMANNNCRTIQGAACAKASPTGFDKSTGHGFGYGGKCRVRIGRRPALWRKTIRYGEYFWQ